MDGWCEYHRYIRTGKVYSTGCRTLGSKVGPVYCLMLH